MVIFVTTIENGEEVRIRLYLIFFPVFSFVFFFFFVFHAKQVPQINIKLSRVICHNMALSVLIRTIFKVFQKLRSRKTNFEIFHFSSNLLKKDKLIIQ